VYGHWWETDETLRGLAVSGFLAEVGKKLADRWLDLLVLPGVLWVAALIAATRLGQEHPFDVGRLRVWLDGEAAHPSSHSLATVLLAVVGLLAAAAAVGLGASALGGVLQRAWVLPGWRRPLTWVVSARQRRWDKATAKLRKAIAVAANPAAHHQDPARAARRMHEAEQRRSALGVSRPERPTRIADRFYFTAIRINSAYGLDLDLAWPRLWTVLLETLRTDLATAQDAYTAAARLTAWGLLYTLLGIAWWPAIVPGVTVVAAGWLRARAAAPVLADLIETAADLHTGDLAAKLGIPATAPLTPVTGQAITRVLRKTPSRTPGQAPTDDPMASPASSLSAPSTPSAPDGPGT
jgi:hypothetical protein